MQVLSDSVQLNDLVAASNGSSASPAANKKRTASDVLSSDEECLVVPATQSQSSESICAAKRIKNPFTTAAGGRKNPKGRFEDSDSDVEYMPGKR